jgi:hypothetical protein
VDRWYAYGDRNKLSPNYQNQPVAFFPANGNFTGNTTLNFYQVKPGTTGPNITANDLLVNEPGFQTLIPVDEQLAARETRYAGVVNANYSPTDWLKFYDRFIIQRNEENTETPNQGFSAADGIVIPANNPFNPFGEALTPNGQLEREFGPWSEDFNIRTLRNIVGGTIQLPHDWFIDGNFLYGESDSTQYVYNSIIKNRLQEALNGTLPGFEGVFFNPFTDQNLNIHPNQQFYPVRYKPFEDLTFRGSYSEGFIAPTLGELFITPLQFQTFITDPQNGMGYNVLLTNPGNRNLQPQNSYSYYLEALWTPGSGDDSSWWHWAKGFSAYIDWYQILLRNEISTIAAQTLVAAPNAFPGASVIRGGNGLVQEIISPYQNVGNTLTDGIDFGASYITKEYNWGKLDFELNATYMYKYDRSRLEGNFVNGLPVTPSVQVLQSADAFGVSGPDFKLVASLFYSKHVFGNDNFRTGFTLNYIDSQVDGLTNFKGSLPAADAGLFPPGSNYQHLVGDWTTVDWQISYELGAPPEVTPESPRPGYDKDGKRILGEKAISPKSEGARWNWRTILANTTLTFGTNNIADTRPPLSSDSFYFQGYDTQSATPIQRYFYVQVEKKF